MLIATRAVLGRMVRNTVFRLSLLGAVLFGVSLLIAQLIVYDRIVSSEVRRIDAGLREELVELRQLFDRGGTAAVQAAQRAGILPPPGVTPTEEQKRQIEIIYERGAQETTTRVVTLRELSPDIYTMFVFKDARFGKLVTPDIYDKGIAAEELKDYNSSALIQERAIASVANPETGESEDRRIQAIGNVLFFDDQKVGILFVGRDIENIMRTGERMRAAMALSSLIALLLGVFSSFFVARRFAQRVDSLNTLANDVRSGHLDRRAARTYSEDEMDRLAEHLNAMLDHIERLMAAMRYAGDSVAHDLRTPLTRLRTRLESAAVELGDTNEADILFAAANDAGELLATFDAVLRIARLEAGERRELLSLLDPKPILDDMVELYEPACEEQGLLFTHHIEPGLMIMADRGLLSQAMSNLIENAIKYTPADPLVPGLGRIHLSARRQSRGTVCIAVSDDGPGIPIFDRERVKERFVRLDKSRTLPGSGLGLALVDAVAELHQAQFNMRDGLGVLDPIVTDDGEDPDAAQRAADRPGLRAELVFTRAKPARKVSNETQTSDAPS